MLASLSYAFLFSLYILSPSPLSEQRQGLPAPSLRRTASAPSPCPHNSLKEHNPSTKNQRTKETWAQSYNAQPWQTIPPSHHPIRASSGTLNALWQKSLDPSQPGWLEASRSGFCPLVHGTPYGLPTAQHPQFPVLKGPVIDSKCIYVMFFTLVKVTFLSKWVVKVLKSTCVLIWPMSVSHSPLRLSHLLCMYVLHA